ncbi:MAG: Cache 3/Cache 2 fusion domain-containing protein [Oligoflexia bacterium]|nr:Cache 3/Cache 2 fusion domain-containing protein [Oligoflexia bacterium]
MPTLTNAETSAELVKKTMSILKEKTAKLGAPKLEGISTEIADRPLPILKFGDTKINTNNTIVDEIKSGNDRMSATLFVAHNGEYIRISTSVYTIDNKRAIGTKLAKNAAFEAIEKGESFYGEVDILGLSYQTGYEPIRNSKGETIGVYFVGYKLKY